MSSKKAEENEFDWVDPRPDVELYHDEGMLVAHEFINPYGWLASSETMEVKP